MEKVIEESNHEVNLNSSLSENSLAGDEIEEKEISFTSGQSDEILQKISKEIEYDKTIFERMDVRRTIKSNTHIAKSTEQMRIRITEDITKIIEDMTIEDFNRANKIRYISCKIDQREINKQLEKFTKKESSDSIPIESEDIQLDSKIRTKSIKFSYKKTIFEYPKEREVSSKFREFDNSNTGKEDDIYSKGTDCKSPENHSFDFKLEENTSS